MPGCFIALKGSAAAACMHGSHASSTCAVLAASAAIPQQHGAQWGRASSSWNQCKADVAALARPFASDRLADMAVLLRKFSDTHSAVLQCNKLTPPPPRPCRSLERLSCVPAGNVLALSGLETTILKSATLSSSPACLPLAPMTFQAAPIVRVALEPSCPSDMAALAQGLKLLNRWGEGGRVNKAVRGAEHPAVLAMADNSRCCVVCVSVNPQGHCWISCSVNAYSSCCCSVPYLRVPTDTQHPVGYRWCHLCARAAVELPPRVISRHKAHTPPHACPCGCPTTVLFVAVVVVHRADPFVEVGLSEKGEHLLGAAGEVHLETVVKDLKERFARVPFQVRTAGGGGHGGALKHTTVHHTLWCGPDSGLLSHAHRVAGSSACSMFALQYYNRRLEVAACLHGSTAYGVRLQAHTSCVAPVCSQVSPPLVAFKESVLSGSEPPEGVTVKAAKVVEASTPSGVCVVRVKAHALPNSTAALLDEHANLIKDLLEQQHRQADRQQKSQQPLPQQQHCENGVQQQLSSSRQRCSLDHGEHSKEAVKLREAFRHSTEGLSNKQLSQLLQRAWLLGPRNAGPNIALCSPCRAGSSSSSGSSLFDVPASQVVRASSKHAPLAKLTGTPAAEHAPGKHQPHHHSEHAAANGVSSHEPVQAATEAAEAAADADPSQQQQPHQQQLSIPFGLPSAAQLLQGQPAAGVTSCSDAEAAAAAAGLSELWPHITSSVESGVTAGFQMATAAGPLCDEPLWGVVFELEVRLILPAHGTQLDLAEGVYGPFSGQVRHRWFSCVLHCWWCGSQQVKKRAVICISGAGKA